MVRDEGLTRSVVPPWFGAERPTGRSHPSLQPSAWAKRNPLLSFHGFWLGGEFGEARAGLHRSPAL